MKSVGKRNSKQFRAGIGEKDIVEQRLEGDETLKKCCEISS